MDLNNGTILGNRYVIQEEIGAGGMSIVYKAQDRLLNRTVAVKVLRPEHNSDDEFVKRFDIEAQAAASLNHPNIISIFDVGCQGDIHYIVMELVEGVTLKKYIYEHKAMSYTKALDLSMQICSAMEHAHQKHIIHRDIKPQNIIVSPSGKVKVTDFGIARATVASTTKLGSVMGSAHYLSPEQARGGYTDERSDIYSFGVCMYEMFTGKLPFEGDNAVSVAMQHLQKTPEPPCSVNPAVPPSVEVIILKAMSKEQRLRYASARELYEDLERIKEDPTAPISKEPAEDDMFSTKKIPVITDVVEEEKPEIQQGKKNPTPKGDKIAVIAAIITSVLVVAVAAFIMVRIFWGAPKNEMPSFLNMTLEAAQEKAQEYGVTVWEAQSTYQENVAEGLIYKQEPEAGTAFGKNEETEVLVYISLGSGTVVLEDYAAWEYQDVIKALTSEGLTYKIEEEESEEYEKNLVIRTMPGPKTSVKAGDTVTVYVSRGMEEKLIPVPDLIGYSKREAEDRLAEKDLAVGEVGTISSTTVPEGFVAWQSHEKGAEVEPGTAIDIKISAGAPRPVERKFSFYVQADSDDVSVEITNRDSGATVYSKNHKNGDYVEFSIKDVGVQVFDIYYNDMVNDNFTINFDE